MIILAVDSSAKVASCALLEDDRVVGEIYLDIGLVHSKTLAPMVKKLLDISCFNVRNIDLFCVSNGPGSFTGVRIGVALIKGMAMPLRKQIMGVSTLHALAFNAINQKNAVVCACMDARRDQLYAALFEIRDKKVLRITADEAISCRDLFLKLLTYKEKDVVLVGDGTQVFLDYINANSRENKTFIRQFSESLRYQFAKNVALAAMECIKNGEKTYSAEHLPVRYLRPSQAERERNVFIN